MQNKIQSISKTKTLDYSKLNTNYFWKKRKTNKSNFSTNNAAQIIHVLQTQKDSLICIQTEVLTDTKLIEVLFEAAKSNRIYLLLNEKNEAISKLNSACLIRFEINNIGSSMLINPNTNDTKGFIFNGQLTEQSFAYPQNLLVDLDKEQVKTLFQHFCYHFWNTAKQEILGKTVEKVVSPPIDIYPCTQNFCDTDFVQTKLKESVNNSKISISAIRNGGLLEMAKVKNSQIITCLTQNNSELLKEMKANGNEIFALTPANPFHLIGDWFIPKITILNDAIFYALPLNKTQKEKIDTHFAMLQEAATYEYFNQKSRKDLLDETFCFTEKTNEEITITSHSTIQAANCSADELLPKEDFDKQESIFYDNGKSLSITFTWENEPYFAPKHAKKHKIYKDWDDFEKKIAAFIDKIEAKIAEGEKSESSISTALKSFFLGKKTFFSNLKSELDALKNKPFSHLAQTEMKQIIAKLNEVYEKIVAEIGEIEVEDKKAKIAEEIEKLMKEKKEKEKLLLEYETKLSEKEEEKAKKETVFYQKYHTNESNFSKFKSELEQKAGKNNKAKNPQEAATAQAILDEWRDLQNAIFVDKIKEESVKMKKEIEGIGNNISRKEKERNGIKPTEKKEEESSLSLVTEKNKGQKIATTNENSLQNPNLQPLPQVGELYEVGNQNYLAIEYWEEYDLGKNEAKRLNAKLCTTNQ